MKRSSICLIPAASLVLAAGVVSADDWPQEVVGRPLTLDAGASEGHVVVSVDALRFTSTTDGKTSYSTDEGLALGGTIGVTNRLDVGVDYQLTLSEFEAKGPFSVRLRYRIIHCGPLDVAVAASMTYDLLGSNGDFFVGADARYRLLPELAIGTSTTGVLMPAIPGLSPMAGQLQIGFTRNTTATGESVPEPITLDLPVYAAFTPTPAFQLFLGTNLGQINLSNSANAFLFSKLIPVTAGLFYSPRHTVDLGAAIWDDLEHAGNAFDILAFARFYKL